MSDHPHAHLDPLAHVAQPDQPDELADARARAGKAVRDLGHALIGHHAPMERIDHVTATLDSLTAELSRGSVRTRSEVSQIGDWANPADDGEALKSYDERPVSGRASPWGLDVDLRREGDDAVATLTLRAAHEGAPKRSHGGIVAALFDDVFGFVLSFQSQAAFTGELAIRYEAGVPIGEPLECRVRLTEVKGRKLLMAGELTCEGRVLARSTATFITIDSERFAAGPT